MHQLVAPFWIIAATWPLFKSLFSVIALDVGSYFPKKHGKIQIYRNQWLRAFDQPFSATKAGQLSITLESTLFSPVKENRPVLENGYEEREQKICKPKGESPSEEDGMKVMETAFGSI